MAATSVPMEWTRMMMMMMWQWVDRSQWRTVQEEVLQVWKMGTQSCCVWQVPVQVWRHLFLLCDKKGHEKIQDCNDLKAHKKEESKNEDGDAVNPTCVK